MPMLFSMLFFSEKKTQKATAGFEGSNGACFFDVFVGAGGSRPKIHIQKKTGDFIKPADRLKCVHGI